MRKIWDLIARPILDMTSGMQIGVIREVILDIDRATIFCVLLKETETETETETEAAAIKFNDLYRIGPDVVTVRTKSVIRKLSLYASELFKFTNLSDKPVYCETGINIGTLMDIYYDGSL